MAIPTSGVLSVYAMAQEALYGTYGSGTITGPISIYDMVNGGNSHGSGNSYPTVNDNCTPNPLERTSVPLYQMYQSTQIDNNFPSISGPFTYYVNQDDTTLASGLGDNDRIYSDSTLSTLVGPFSSSGTNPTITRKIYQDETGLLASQKICSLTENYFQLNTSSEIFQFNCFTPE
jgi:hypothetical protein